jgi:hypothetical protein
LERRLQLVGSQERSYSVPSGEQAPTPLRHFHQRIVSLPRGIIQDQKERKLTIFPSRDEELHNWLRWAEKDGSSFLKATAEAALIADLKHYNLLWPVLLELKKEWPEPA